MTSKTDPATLGATLPSKGSCEAAENQLFDDASPNAAWLAIQVSRVVARRPDLLAEADVIEAALEHIFTRSGKQLRPLILLAFASLGPSARVPSEDAITAAAAVELLHECSLVHDDIADHSLVRRGKASTAAYFGVRSATHVGAYLAGQGVRALGDCCARSGIRLDLDLLRDLARAQILEALPPAPDIGEQQRRMEAVIHGKSGALFLLAMRIGAQLGAPGSTPPLSDECIVDLAQRLAKAFQIRDDILDIEADDRLRRPGNNDILQAKPNWPILLWAMAAPDPPAAWQRLRRCIGDRNESERLRTEVLESGAVAQARKSANSHLAVARKTLVPLPASVGRAVLMEIFERLRLDP